MKPIYLLLLVLMACGFFACTTDYATGNTEISPQPEGNIMDAASFSVFTADLDDLGLFDDDEQLFDGEHGSEDFRLYIEEGEGSITVDFLTDNAEQEDELTLKEILAIRPVRNWSTTITLHHKPGDGARFQDWLTTNFSGNVYVDLRLTVLDNGDIQMSGLVPTEAELEQFSDVPLFIFN